MKLILIFILLLAGCTARVQPLLIQPNRLLTNSADLSGQPISDDPSIRSIRASNGFSSTIIIKKQDGAKERVPAKSVWGYSDKNGNVWRRQKRSFFQVVKIGEFVEYVTITHTSNQINGITHNDQQTVWLFSRTLDSPIYSSKKRVLRDTLALSR